jgi:cell division septation protein DedD
MILQNLKVYIFLIFLLLLNPVDIFAQDVDIVPYLKQIENGNVDEVKNQIPDLKEKYPNSPSIMFLDGVLTENGQKAVVIYQNIVDKYPASKYADAALYRLYSYYYALGLYESAKEKLNQLISKYPDSPYIKIAKQNQLPVNPEISQKENKAIEDSVKTPSPPVVRHNQVYKFTIQAGAFSKNENAETLKFGFDKAGIFSEITEKQVAGTVFHVVYVGRFITRAEADNFLITINNKFDLNGRVTEIPK